MFFRDVIIRGKNNMGTLGMLWKAEGEAGSGRERARLSQEHGGPMSNGALCGRALSMCRES